MTFVQIIEYETTRPKELEETLDEWVRTSDGKRTATHELRTFEHDNKSHFVDIVEFPSYEMAMRNSDLPETRRYAKKLTSLCTTKPRYLNLEVSRDESLSAPARIRRMSLNQPEEVRRFEGGMGRLELVNVEGGGIGRATFEPGWRWSEHVKPIAGTDSCEASHVGYVISGRIRVKMNDGAEEEYGPGDFMIVPPGHDAWVVGDKKCVAIDWQGFADYAKR
jgi:quercetin dioxygenase-like cupin family protein